MYTPRPKNMMKFLTDTSTSDVLHTWEYADKVRRATPGSDGSLTLSARKKRELDRKAIGAYRSSRIANTAASMRGDIARFTQEQRQKIISRQEKDAKKSSKKPPAQRPNI